MEDSYEIILAREIERIVSSPYPTQLKHLRDLLCARQCSEIDIYRCIAIKSCKVNRLATCLLESLPQWPYVLEIITHLACDISVRDALIRQQPNLIHDVVSQAIKPETALRPRYADAAVALLAHPLGSTTTLPSNVQELFVRLVRRTVKQPSRCSIRSIYLLLKGTSTLLLGLLDSALLWDFEQQLLDVLKSTAKKWREAPEAPDPKVSMYCLAIMAIVITVTNNQQLRLVTNGSWDSQELLVSTQGLTDGWDAPAIREYFAESKKSTKTLHLLVIQVNNSLNTPEETANVDSILETLQLANEILQAFSTGLRNSFCATSGDLISKLQKKALVPEVDFRLRFLAFCFIVQLSGADGLLSMTVDAIRECICHSKSLVRANFFGSVSLIDHLFEAAHTPSTVTMLIQSLLDHLVKSAPTPTLESQVMIAYAIAKLQNMSENDDKVAQAVADAVATASAFSKFQDIYDRLARRNLDSNAAKDGCIIAARRAHSDVCHALCIMVLQNALLSRYRKHWDIVPPQNMEKLLAILDLASRGKCEKVCAHERNTNAHPKMVFAEEMSTPILGDTDWRQAMEQRLGGKAQDERRALIAIFAYACADLESRCVTAEEPLRKEMEKRKSLEKDLDNMRVSYKRLEEQMTEQCLRADGFESEIERKDEALQQAEERVDELQGAIYRLRHEMDESRQVTDQHSTELRQALDSAALEHAAALANKQHLLEDALQAAEEANISRASRDEDVQRLQQDLQQELADAQTTKISLQNLQGLLAENEIRLAEAMDQANKDRASAQENFEEQLQEVRFQAEQEQAAREQQLREVRDQAKQWMDANNASHNEVLERLSAQHGEEIARLEAKLSESKEQMREAQQQIVDQSNEISENQQTAQEQHRKIERLEKRYKAKDDEVKAQIKANNEWRSKLLFDLSMPPQAQAAVPQRKDDTTNDTQMGDDPSPPTPASGTDRVTHLQQADAPVDSTGDHRSPEPKRSRRSFNAVTTTPSKAQARFSLESIPRSSRQAITARTQRRPLLNISSNQLSRATVPEKAIKPRCHAEDEETVVDDETQYDGNEIFTGTQRNDLSMDFDGH